MGDFASINFPCPACGALFALSEKVAKRKIQCPCGKVFVAPAMPELLPDTEAYDLHEHPTPAPTTKTVAAAMASRTDLHPHRSVKSFSTDDSEPEFSLLRDRVAPIVLLAAGLALRVAEMPHDRSLQYDSRLIAFAVLTLQILLSISAMLAGALLASKLVSAHFGSIGTAILKLAAIAVFGWAIGASIFMWLKYGAHAYVAIHVMFLFYAAAFATLFTLDLQEALATVVICALLQNAAALVVFMT